MGSSYSCCIKNESNTNSTADIAAFHKTDLHFDSSTNFSNNHTTCQTLTPINPSSFNNFNTHSQTVIKVKQSIKPKRNRSSLVVKPYNISITDINKVDLKRAKSELHPVNEYRVVIEERLCNFSKKNHLIQFDDETAIDQFNSTKCTVNNKCDARSTCGYAENYFVTVKEEIQMDSKDYGTELHDVGSSLTVSHNHLSKSIVKKSKSKKPYEEIDEPFSEIQIQYIKRILYDEELFIEEMDKDTM